MQHNRRTTDLWWVLSTTATRTQAYSMRTLASPPELLFGYADASPILKLNRRISSGVFRMLTIASRAGSPSAAHSLIVPLMMRRRSFAALGSLSVLARSAAAQTQNWPTRPIHIVCGFSVGTTTDRSEEHTSEHYSH